MTAAMIKFDDGLYIAFNSVTQDTPVTRLFTVYHWCFKEVSIFCRSDRLGVQTIIFKNNLSVV